MHRSRHMVDRRMISLFDNHSFGSRILDSKPLPALPATFTRFLPAGSTIGRGHAHEQTPFLVLTSMLISRELLTDPGRYTFRGEGRENRSLHCFRGAVLPDARTGGSMATGAVVGAHGLSD